MSPGIRSGVNCTRGVHRQRAERRSRTSSVLAVPGTPSISTCAAAQQRNEQPGDRGVLADHGLGDLGAHGRRAARGGPMSPDIRSHSCTAYLWSSSASCLARVIKVSVAGRYGARRAEQRRHLVRTTAGATGHLADDDVGGSVRAEAGAGRRSGPRAARRSEAAACAAVARAPVEPAEAAGGLDGAHHDRQSARSPARRAGAPARDHRDHDDRPSTSAGRTQRGSRVWRLTPSSPTRSFERRDVPDQPVVLPEQPQCDRGVASARRICSLVSACVGPEEHQPVLRLGDEPRRPCRRSSHRRGRRSRCPPRE